MIDYFKNLLTAHSSQSQVLLFAVLFFIVWNIENIAGVLSSYKKWKHAFVNASFILTNIPVQLLLGIAFIKVITWTSVNHFGILYFLPGNKNPLILFVSAFILLDLGEYIYHRIMHRVKRLWMFHMVHHSDTVVDVSTTLREHPGESFIRLTFTLVWVFLTGTSFWILLLRQIIQSFSTVFSHMNYRLPEKLDKVLGWVVITPNLHQVHHHYKQPYTDCNYGDVLSIWDRLFGTFKRMNSKDLVFGVDTCLAKNENSNFAFLAKLPFNKYRHADIVQPQEEIKQPGFSMPFVKMLRRNFFFDN